MIEKIKVLIAGLLSKKIVIVLFFFLALAVVFIRSSFTPPKKYLALNVPSDGSYTPQPTKMLPAFPIEKTPEEEIKSWKTFYSADNLIRFKYPADWFIYTFHNCTTFSDIRLDKNTPENTTFDHEEMTMCISKDPIPAAPNKNAPLLPFTIQGLPGFRSFYTDLTYANADFAYVELPVEGHVSFSYQHGKVRIFELILGSITFQGLKQDSPDGRRFSARPYDIDGTFFKDVPFPDRIKRISNTDLIGLDCTPLYVYKENGVYDWMNPVTKEKETMNNTSLIEAIKKIKQIYSSGEVRTIMMCETNGDISFVPERRDPSFITPTPTPDPLEFKPSGKFVLFGLYFGDKSRTNGYYIARIEKTTLLLPSIVISDISPPYYYCDRALALSTRGSLFVTCVGGESVVSHSIYEIDMTSHVSRKLQKCTYSEGNGGADAPWHISFECS